MSVAARLPALVAVAVVVSSLTVGLSGTGAAQTDSDVVFEYESDTAATATERVNTTYAHNISVRTNASEAPIVLTVFYNQSADIEYESVDAELGGDSIAMAANTTEITRNGRELTRVRLTARSVSTSGVETLNTTVNLRTPAAVTTETILTGGTHGPTGQTLDLQSTSLTTEAPDPTPTDIELSEGDAEPGDQVTLTGTVTNAGDRPVNDLAVSITANGTELTNQTVNLTAGATTEVQADWTPSDDGDYTVRMSVYSATVEESTANNSLVTTYSIDTSSSAGGGSSGGGGGSSSSSGSSISSQTATPTATPTTTATQTQTVQETATPVSTDTDTTVETRTETETNATVETTSGDGPGFGVGVVCLAVIVAALLGVRRSE